MTKTRRTKRALLMSALSLLLCVSMLIGSTFAWFTDSVTSAGNKIQSGTLKVDLELLEKDGSWTSIKDSGKALFNYDLWEPGYTEVKILRVVNEGNLALKWYAKLSSLEPTVLADAIDVYVNTQVQSYPADRNDLTGWKNVGSLTDFISGISMTTNGTLLPKDAEGNGGVAYLGLALKMRESAGNEYQDLDLGGVFDITIFATQYTYEEDSFDDQYDAAASWTGTVDTGWYNTTDSEFVLTSADDLAGLAQLVNNGTDNFTNKTIKLGADIDLNYIPWTPIGTTSHPFNGKFDGEGHTISKLYVNGGSWVGLIGYVQNAAHIEDVVIDDAEVSGDDYVGAVLGGGYLAKDCVIRCAVKNATVTATPFLMADGVTYDGGAKAGAVVGYAINGNICENTATNCTVVAFRDLGSIAGMVSGENRAVTVSGNDADTVTLKYFDLNGAAYYENKVNGNMGDIAGRTGGTYGVTIADDDLSDDGVIRDSLIYWIDNGVKYSKDVDTNEVVLYEVLADCEDDTVNVPEGVTALGNYSFSTNANVKTVILPTTVTTLNRAFDSSAVETVVLNEGLEQIDSRAFRSTSALKEVVISSTVKEIADNAFQKSGIKEITIPANVETIGETAFGASKIETVIIEGNTSIQGYAFRGCPNLRTVYLCGDDVTFIASTLNGRNSMWFCNGESNNPNTSNITFYVANETVKQRVLTAMGAEANNTPVIIASIPTGETPAEAAQDLTDSLANGKDTVLPTDLTFKASDTTASSGYGATGVAVKNGATLDGNGKTLTVTNANSTWDCAVNAAEGTIKNLTVSGAMRGIFMGDATGDVYIDNVIFDDVIYTFNSDGGSKNYGVYISNSTLNGWTSFSNVHKEVVFTDCTFGEGSGYAYCRPYNNSVFVGCKFEEGFKFDTMKASEITFVDCYYGDTLITAENATSLAKGDAVFFFAGIGNVNFGTGVSNAADLTAALANGESVVLTEDMTLEELAIPEGAKVDINLSGSELSVEKLEAKDAEVTISGGTLEHGESNYPAVSVNDGGKMVLNNVDIVCNEYCNLYDNGNVQAAEYVGLQVFGGVCELNNCNIEVNVDEVRYMNSAYGIAIHDGELIMNGGSVKVTSPGSTKADYQAAFAGWQDGEKTITLNKVAVDAKNYFEAGGGNTTINTTDANGSWADKCVVSGGTYTINYK